MKISYFRIKKLKLSEIMKVLELLNPAFRNNNNNNKKLSIIGNVPNINRIQYNKSGHE